SKPMNIEEAVFEMEKAGYNFWFFMDKPSKQMQVVFKRLDNSYGILQSLKK
ncbi:MAG: sigma 54 modulation/S30EA ribosomal C-terminal domain-containing protein, partial [Elusimicrobiales bacterium]|nr:sigma 54 modulation/S30EA ribosomal C-terminal domain-containing protein [Elusimicrobiales bacterium]